MEEAKVRRLPVIDHNGKCCGIVSQADVALHVGGQQIGEVVREISNRAAGSRY
jgi:CBS domain-containing protein